MSARGSARHEQTIALVERPRVRLLGCNGHTWPLMQYKLIDPNRLAFIKPGGLTQPLPVVITTGPGIHQAQSPEG